MTFWTFFKLLDVEEKADADFFGLFLKFWTREKNQMQTFFDFFEFFAGHVVVSGISMGGHFEV
jgi:hypothetical protein